MPIETGKAPTSASPLWIIALFIALSEATAGAAAITTNGSTRLIFACFAVAFPAIVFTVFIWLLIKHAPKLYAPGQYSSDITPEIYRTGINRADAAFLSRAVAKTVVLGDARAEDDSSDDQSFLERQIDRAQRIFEEVIEESIAEIEVVSSGHVLAPLRIVITRDMTVAEFLNEIWFELRGAVDAYTYGSQWVLVDGSTGKVYNDIGRDSAPRERTYVETRLLSSVGINLTSNLRVIIMSNKSSNVS